jgi:basic membrane protein A
VKQNPRGDTVDDQWHEPQESEAELAGQLDTLQRAQHQLWAALREEEDPETRMTLLSRFSANRASIVRLSEALGVETSETSKPAYRVSLVDPGADGGLDRELSPPSVVAPQLDRAPLAQPDPALPSDPESAPPSFLDRVPRPERAPSRPVEPTPFETSSQPEPGGRLGRFEPVQAELADVADLDARRGRSQSQDPDPSELVDRVDDQLSQGWDDDDDDYGRPPRRRAPDVNRFSEGSQFSEESWVDQFDQVRESEADQPFGSAHHRASPFEGGDPMPSLAAPFPSARPVPAPTGPVKVVGQVLTAAQESPRHLVAMAGIAAAVVAVILLVLTMPFGGTSEPNMVASELSSDTTSPAGVTVGTRLDEIIAVLDGLGYGDISIEDRDGVIYLSGTVGSTAERDAAVGAARALAGDQVVDASALAVAGGSGAGTGDGSEAGGRAAALQAELDRVIAATPIIFDVGESELTELHLRILNTVASIMIAYPDLPVTVIGFTDGSGPDDNNRQLSEARANAVRDYLISQGVAESALETEPLGEDTSTGSRALANLERRVEFEVAVPIGSPPAASDALLRIAIVAPSARNDLAFSQSMVDAVNAIAAERGNIEISITDNTFVPDDAAAAVRDYASQDYDLVIAHGSQFGGALLEIAQEFPDVAFAWGTASDTFGLPNVYAYDAAAHQGGYVMGAMASLLTGSDVIGVVGPIEVGDAQLYVNGFQAGAKGESPSVDVRVTYTGSFSDLTLAAETAQSHIDAGADVMTGSAQMVVGAVSTASEQGVLWFGTQSNQSSLAPPLVVASQVYHWEVILRAVVADIDAGVMQGRSATADLANGGLVIEFNPSYGLPEGVRQRADQIIADIISGAVVVPNGA